MAGTGGGDLPTPKYVSSTALDSPMEEQHDPIMSIDEAVRSSQPEERPHTVSPADTMRPPPLPAKVLAAESKRELTPASTSTTSPEEAQQALDLVMSFIEQHGQSYLTHPETVQVVKLLGKLKLQSLNGT